MKRDINSLSNRVYDVCIIGGGIYGVCIAWDAILRGLSVILVDRGDFGGATSSNSLRVIHGGLRYLRNGNVFRTRESAHERMVWMRIAPHLVHPLPFIIPTYKNSLNGKFVLYIAMLVYDLISFDRNRVEDPEKHIPRGKIISKEDCVQFLPEIDEPNLTGAAVFYDGQMYNSERLLLSVLKSAAKAGAVVANYMEVTGFLRNGDRVTGVEARDVLSGDRLDVRAKMVVNTAGPWVNEVLHRLNGNHPKNLFSLSKAVNLVVNRLYSQYGFALRGRGSRLFFVTPWRNRSFIGTAHLPFNGDLDSLKVTEKEIRELVGEINKFSPNIPLRYEDVRFWHSGLVPAKEDYTYSDHVHLTRRYQILDHHKREGIDGLISVIGIKFTTARCVAEKVVDLVFRKSGYIPPKKRSADTPIYGGSIRRIDTFLSKTLAEKPYGLDEGAIQHVALNYGSAYPEVLKYADGNPDGLQKLARDLNVLTVEVLHAIREEMAQKLTDLLFRRTELGTLGYPGDACVKECATLISKELGWGDARTEKEIEEVKSAFSLGTENG